MHTVSGYSTRKERRAQRGPPASITSSMRQDSLFVVASVCCQLARPVSACRLIHPRETKGSICDIHFSEAFFKVTAAAGAPAGGELGMASTSRRSDRGGATTRCRTGDKKQRGCRCLYVVRAGWRIVLAEAPQMYKSVQA